MNTQEVIQAEASNVLDVLAQFSTSAEGIAKFAHLVITEVEEGRADPLKIALFMKTMEKIKERVNKVLTSYYLNEASKYGEKPFDFSGAEIALTDVGARFDYSGCNHPAWNDLTRIIDHATEQRKEIEALLKALKNPTDLIIEGEGVTVKPPVRSAKAGIKISIK